MRRQLAIATLATLIATPMWAQMRGVARGGVSMGRPGFVSRGPVMVNRGPMITNRAAFIRHPQAVGFGGNFHAPFFHHNRFFFNQFHHRHCLFFGFYPFSGYPWYDAYPAYYGDYSYLVGPSSYEAAYDSASAYNAANTELADAIARLSDEVQHLQEARQSREALPAKPEPGKNSEPPESALLVFRDKHTQEVKNYAIVGPTLWILNERRAMRVLLSTLDIDATIKRNEERGIEFRLPK